MSHGGGGGSAIKSEPNLTPMLDMVLQLVMFFMLVANFTMEQVNEDVKLPAAQSARPVDKTEIEVLYLNLNGKGEIVVPNRGPVEVTQVRGYLKDRFDEASELAREKHRRDSTASDQVQTVVIIRGHREADFGPIYNVLREAKAVGFKKWQLRVQSKNS